MTAFIDMFSKFTRLLSAVKGVIIYQDIISGQVPGGQPHPSWSTDGVTSGAEDPTLLDLSNRVRGASCMHFNRYSMPEHQII